jgi:hypothetical protein
MASTRLAATNGLTALIQDLFADTDVQVYLLRLDGDLAENYVWVGVNPVRTTRVWKTIGRLQRAEVTEIDCRLSCWSGEYTPSETADRVAALFDQIDDALMDQMNPMTVQPVMGIPALFTPRVLITSEEMTAGDTEGGGAAAEIVFTVTVDSLTYRSEGTP